VYPHRNLSTFQRCLLPPSSGRFVNLKMKAVNISETSINFYDITLRNIPKDSLHHSRYRESLKFQEWYTKTWSIMIVFQCYATGRPHCSETRCIQEPETLWVASRHQDYGRQTAASTPDTCTGGCSKDRGNVTISCYECYANNASSKWCKTSDRLVESGRANRLL
jgi:hypothetical protein